MASGGIRNVEHQVLVDKILLAVGSMPNVRCWSRSVGVGRALGNSSHVIRFGINGESDIDGIIGPSGRRLSIEVKTGKAVLSPDQRRWKAMIEKFGGLFIEARSVEDAVNGVKDAIRTAF